MDLAILGNWNCSWRESLGVRSFLAGGRQSRDLLLLLDQNSEFLLWKHLLNCGADGRTDLRHCLIECPCHNVLNFLVCRGCSYLYQHWCYWRNFSLRSVRCEDAVCEELKICLEAFLGLRYSLGDRTSRNNIIDSLACESIEMAYEIVFGLDKLIDSECAINDCLW